MTKEQSEAPVTFLYTDLVYWASGCVRSISERGVPTPSRAHYG